MPADPVSSPPTCRSLWDVVDAAMVINLDHRTDRWASVREHLRSRMPPDKLHRVSAVLGKEIDGYETSSWFRRTKRPATWAGRAGCSLSHRNAMRIAMDHDWQWVLMIEDDAQFVAEFDDERGRELGDFLLSHGPEFGFVYLGFDSPLGPIRRIDDLDQGYRVYQIGGASTTHSYLIHRRVMKKLLAEFPQSESETWPWIARHVVIDRWYSLNLYCWTGVAAVSPQFAIQEPSVSDITQRAGDYEGDPKVDCLRPIAMTDRRWRLAAARRRLLRPMTILPHVLKGFLRRCLGF